MLFLNMMFYQEHLPDIRYSSDVQCSCSISLDRCAIICLKFPFYPYSHVGYSVSFKLFTITHNTQVSIMVLLSCYYLLLMKFLDLKSRDIIINQRVQTFSRVLKSILPIAFQEGSSKSHSHQCTVSTWPCGFLSILSISMYVHCQIDRLNLH